MKIRTEDYYQCDGCGKSVINPVGWSRIVPNAIGKCDFRSSEDDICDDCYRAIKRALATRVNVT